MKQLAAFLALIAAGPALAQVGPGFDCAKASTAVEKVICADVNLAALDRKMAAVYGVLLGKLDGPARDHLSRDQMRWLGNRSACAFNAALLGPCLDERYRGRIALLGVFGQGSYPFIGEHAVVLAGKNAAGRDYTVDAGFPAFEASRVDFSAINRGFVECAWRADDTAVADGAYERSFALYRLAGDVVSVSSYAANWTAHVSIANTGTLVNLRTGRRVPPDDVFVPGDVTHRQFLDLVADAVKKEFAEGQRPEKLEDLSAMLAEITPSDYIFEEDHLSLELPAVARFLAMKGYGVEIPYSALKPLLRADGPLGSVRHMGDR